MNKYVKFGIPVVAIVGALTWLAFSGISETKSYYKTISELNQMGERAKEQRIRVGGDVSEGSIQRDGRNVSFSMKQDAMMLKVVYSGIDPLPDTFRDGAQALAEGKLGNDGVFHATKIQAKCASKYEAKPQYNGGKPTNEKRAAI